MRPSLLLLTAIASILPLAMAAAAGSPDERASAYREFREAFDKGDYKAALPVADRVVQITRSQFEADTPEVANALTNLATTYYRMRAYGEALDNYLAAATIMERQINSTDKRMVRPLHGLGSTLIAMQRAEDAIAPLKRGLEVVRNLDGMLAADQLPVLATLIDAYNALDRRADAGREQDYAITVAGTAFARDDLQLLGPIQEQARWFEGNRNCSQARSLYLRATQIVENARAEQLLAIPGLRGFARCSRIGYVSGTREPNASAGDGERALLTALEVLGDAPAQAGLRGVIRAELGDWYRIANLDSRAVESWRNAWTELAAAGDTSLLNRPVALNYIAPAMAVSEQQRDPAEYSAEAVTIRFAIDASGILRDAAVVSPGAERAAAGNALFAALSRTTWRPAFRDGQPVTTDDYLFRELIYVRRAVPED